MSVFCWVDGANVLYFSFISAVESVLTQFRMVNWLNVGFLLGC